MRYRPALIVFKNVFKSEIGQKEEMLLFWLYCIKRIVLQQINVERHQKNKEKTFLMIMLFYSIEMFEHIYGDQHKNTDNNNNEKRLSV